MIPRLARGLLLTVVLLWLALPRAAEATWSIILVDTTTREVAIGSATCLASFDLRQGSPVVRVGLGAAAAQSYIDVSGKNRRLLWDELKKGTDPAAILGLLAKQDPSHQTRQYGIVDTHGRRIGFTGSFAFPFANHLTGRIGSIAYAIQGNILTGAPVLQKAEEAVKNTPGDLPARLMAAMQAARAMGGDGRCSCPGNPTACGSPPRGGFKKSAHIGYMIVARQGDQDGSCNASLGCASGGYYMNFNVAFQSASRPDPVIQLQSLFSAWRASWIGRPDHHLSAVAFRPPVLAADGASRTTATLTLRDWQGLGLTQGGATVSVTLDATSTTAVTIGPVTDLKNGTYTFPVTAGTKPGIAALRVVVNDGRGPVLLSPRSILTVVPSSLRASSSSISAASGGTVAFTLTPGASHARRPFFLLASASGSWPGIPVNPTVTIPLNPDLVYFFSFHLANSAILPGTAGALDGTGQATARFVAPPGLLKLLANQSLTFAFALLGPLDFASNPVSVKVVP